MEKTKMPCIPGESALQLIRYGSWQSFAFKDEKKEKKLNVVICGINQILSPPMLGQGATKVGGGANLGFRFSAYNLIH